MAQTIDTAEATGQYARRAVEGILSLQGRMRSGVALVGRQANSLPAEQ